MSNTITPEEIGKSVAMFVMDNIANDTFELSERFGMPLDVRFNQEEGCIEVVTAAGITFAKIRIDPGDYLTLD